jgi:hypothetical protein
MKLILRSFQFVAVLLILALAISSAIGELLAQEFDLNSAELSFNYQSDFLWRFARDARYESGVIYILMPNGLQLYSGGVDFVSPSLISKIPLGSDCDNIELHDHTAICTSRKGVVRLVDVLDPYQMRAHGEIELGDTLFDYASNGDVGYAACGFRGLFAVSQSETGSMSIASVHDEAVHVVAVVPRQDKLYVADDYNGLFIYDLADPLDPDLVDVRFFSRPVNDISFNGEILYVAYGDSGVVSFALGADGTLDRLTSYPTPVSALKVDAFESVVATVDLFGTIYLFDADSSAPRYVAEKRRVSDRVQFVRKNDRDYVLLPDRFGNVDIVSVDHGIEPDLVWQYPGSRIVRDVAVVDGRVFISGSEDDLVIWQAADDGAPTLVSRVTSTSGFGAVESLDSLVLASEAGSDGKSYTHVIQALRPCCIAQDIKSLFAYGDLIEVKASHVDSGQIDIIAYGADGTSLVRIQRVDEEGEIFYPIVAYTDVPSRGTLTAAEWAYGYLYTASVKGAEGMIYDGSEIGRGAVLPVVGEFAIPGKINVLEVFDDVCYLGGSFGLSVCRMDGFGIGEEIERLLPGTPFINIAFDWQDSTMFAALGGSGVAVFDVRDISMPTLLAQQPTLGVAERVDAQGGILAVADHYSVMLFSYRLIRDDGRLLPQAFSLEQNYPNPFNGETRIEFSIPGSSDGRFVNLDIFNILGEMTATLVAQPLSAGAYSLAWNGVDRSGGHAASGVYFYRLSVNGVSQTKKLVFLK